MTMATPKIDRRVLGLVPPPPVVDVSLEITPTWRSFLSRLEPGAILRMHFGDTVINLILEDDMIHYIERSNELTRRKDQ